MIKVSSPCPLSPKTKHTCTCVIELTGKFPSPSEEIQGHLELKRVREICSNRACRWPSKMYVIQSDARGRDGQSSSGQRLFIKLNAMGLAV